LRYGNGGNTRREGGIHLPPHALSSRRRRQNPTPQTKRHCRGIYCGYVPRLPLCPGHCVRHRCSRSSLAISCLSMTVCVSFWGLQQICFIERVPGLGLERRCLSPPSGINRDKPPTHVSCDTEAAPSIKIAIHIPHQACLKAELALVIWRASRRIGLNQGCQAMHPALRCHTRGGNPVNRSRFSRQALAEDPSPASWPL
jgi:hypothetical protein